MPLLNFYDRRPGDPFDLDQFLEEIVRHVAVDIEHHDRRFVNLDPSHVHRGDIDPALSEEGADLPDHPGLVDIVDDQQVPLRHGVDPEAVDRDEPVAELFEDRPADFPDPFVRFDFDRDQRRKVLGIFVLRFHHFDPAIFGDQRRVHEINFDVHDRLQQTFQNDGGQRRNVQFRHLARIFHRYLGNRPLDDLRS